MLRLWPPEMVEKSVPLIVLPAAALLLFVLVALVLSSVGGLGEGFMLVGDDDVGVELRL